jgi:hypothetical protein
MINNMRLMKPFILIVGRGLCAGAVLAQPAIEWQATYGGHYSERAKSACLAHDDGYILAGSTFSNDNGQVSSGPGLGDFWIVKIDESGQLIWEKVLGGTSTEIPESIQPTSDGGYIVAGRSISNDWDVSGNHGSLDCWVVKINHVGAIEWQNSFGGSNIDIAYSIIQTRDGGYLFVGETSSVDGDLVGNSGIRGGWIVKLNGQGAIEWQKAVGRITAGDSIQDIVETKDEGFIFTGLTFSNEGELSNNHGSGDVWVAKYDKYGEYVWQKALGGIGYDIGQSIIECSNTGYILTGYTGSVNSGDVIGGHEGLEAWVVKLDENGEIQWQKCFGGIAEDWGQSIIQKSNNEFILTGTTSSTDGDVIGNDGFIDIWVVDFDQNGNLNWQKTLGGTMDEWSNIILETRDGGFLIAGESNSIDGDITHNFGDYDFWVVKLAPASVATSAPQNLPLQITPNPAQQFVSFELPNGEQAQQVFLSDLLGREILRLNQPSNRQIDLSSLPRGVYVLSVITSDGQRFSGKFRRE